MRRGQNEGKGKDDDDNDGAKTAGTANRLIRILSGTGGFTVDVVGAQTTRAGAKVGWIVVASVIMPDQLTFVPYFRFYARLPPIAFWTKALLLVQERGKRQKANRMKRETLPGLPVAAVAAKM
jgi:hypothetical protein